MEFCKEHGRALFACFECGGTGKWDTPRLDAAVKTLESALVVLRKEQFDRAKAPAHQFRESWQPHPEKRGDEHERYEATCSVCGLTIIDPSDVYPIDHCPGVKALTKEWLTMMGYPEACAPKQTEKKRPYAPPTLRVLDPHEVIRKLVKL